MTVSAAHDSPLGISPIHLLHRAGQRAGDIFAEAMGSGDITPRQYVVLRTIAETEGLSQTDLVVKTGIDRSTLADIVRRLLKKDLISRQRTKRDARTYAVCLTQAGRKALEAAEPAAETADKRILEALPPKQRAIFLSALSQIVDEEAEAEADE